MRGTSFGCEAHDVRRVNPDRVVLTIGDMNQLSLGLRLLNHAGYLVRRCLDLEVVAVDEADRCPFVVLVVLVGHERNLSNLSQFSFARSALAQGRVVLDRRSKGCAMSGG